ncbi:para-aminobenzoate synthetase component 1 [Rhodoligotrophos appendicifer]|uniref:aminodeoxychorismate synthase component I n=1 Tax=Rhodoligotrophos appendicifer TaxID=987056 RepID=UPI001184731B|nr:aminodeoxychorismate synthase component I [Rhodoligotrophos appendicifer]
MALTARTGIDVSPPPGRVPLVHAIPYAEPLELFATFAQDAQAMLFDCPEPGAPRSRHAYIAISPYSTIMADRGGVVVDGHRVAGSPWDILSTCCRSARMRAIPGLPPFQGGAAGLLGYELNRYLEDLPSPAGSDRVTRDMVVGLYDLVIAFDCVRQSAWILSSGLPETHERARLYRAQARCEWLIERLEARSPMPPMDDRTRAPVIAELSRRAYVERIETIKDYISAGDIYQTNFTQKFTATLPSGLSRFDLYRRLRARSRAPFSVFLNIDADSALLSVSPERFVSVDAGGAIETRPIKGTRPRGRTPAEDAMLARDLLASEKDKAENLMIVDLMRNDLSRVAEIGSVRVPTLFGLESFASVHHLVSVVQARLRPGFDAIDLLRAAFPGGSITGAPKIRAMEIIAELEAGPRGAYCGSAFWLGFSGAMDSSILIRSPVVAAGRILIQAGGGIVADSDPLDEYEECLVKARAMIEAVQLTSGTPHADLD